jgi:N-hydroxyarylamine O-acetyltransferase
LLTVSAYLARIAYTQPIRADFQTLGGLQIAHMLSVPFENLDIGLRRRIELSDPALWNKLILQKRGGFCYELNGLFAWLLKQIGFEVRYLNARDYHEEDGSFGIDFDHLTLLVQAPNESTRWLADVGWGDSFTSPLDLDRSGWQEQGLRAYRLEPFKSGYQLWQRGYDGQAERQYYFDLTAHSFPSEYEAACLYHQTSPDSIFTQKRIISRLTPDGRISLDKDSLILTQNGKRSKRPLADEQEFQQLLKEYFGITL